MTQAGPPGRTASGPIAEGVPTALGFDADGRRRAGGDGLKTAGRSGIISLPALREGIADCAERRGAVFGRKEGCLRPSGDG